MMHKIVQSLICLLFATQVAFASQATLVTPGAPLPMTSLATFLNAAFLSVGSQNSGASAPINGPGSAPFAGETWCNTTAALWVCSLYDGTNWNQYGTLDTAGHRFTPFMGASLVSGGLPYGASSTTIGWTAAGGADQFLQGPTPGWASFPNCTGALTYSTSTHLVGCNVSAGSGTVTSVGPSTGITTAPNPITTTGTVAVDQTFSPTWSGTHIFTGPVYLGNGKPYVDVRSGANSCAAAAGDGVTNDLTAIQCQINFMNSTYGGGIVYAPPGSYLIGSGGPVIIKGGVRFVGAGAGSTTVKVTTDTGVIQIDSATTASPPGTCTEYPSIETMFVVGYLNAAATKNAVSIGANCPAIIRDAYIWGGNYGLYTAGVDSLVENAFICGVGSSGGNVVSQGAGWYVRAKFDTCGFTVFTGFVQSTYLPNINGLAENHFVECDFSGSYSFSLYVDDGAHNSALTVINGSVFSQPIHIFNAKLTILSDDEIGSTTLVTNNQMIIHGSYGFSATTVSGAGTRSCAANINITC